MLKPGFTFYDRFIELCNAKCVTPSCVAGILEFSRSCVTDWKKNGTMPRQKTVNKIAHYFDITVDALMDSKCPKIDTKLTEGQVRQYLLGEKNTDQNWKKLKKYIETLQS